MRGSGPGARPTRGAPNAAYDTPSVQRDLLGGSSAVATNPGELTIGGRRDAKVPITDPGMDHAACVVHAIVVYDNALSDAEMVTVYAALRRTWQTP